MSTVTDLASYQKFALEQQAANNEWSAKQADKQMQFQKMMSDTAHQREVADLKIAGLNPVLAAGGQGAATSAGAMADTDTSASANVGAILQQVLQAQSAREVAAMYNAATIQSAMIAAETAREYPNSWAGVASRGIHSAQDFIGEVYKLATDPNYRKQTKASVLNLGDTMIRKGFEMLQKMVRNNPQAAAKLRGLKQASNSNLLNRVMPGVTKYNFYLRALRFLGL